MALSPKQLVIFLLTLCAIVFVVAREDAPSPETTQVITRVQASNTPAPVVTESQGKYEYLEITESCGPNFEGHCIPAYAGPGTQYERLDDLRNGMVLKVKNVKEVNGVTWYRVYFDEWLRHPERVTTEWYVPAVAGRIVTGDGLQELGATTPATNKRIIVDLSDHMIYAYEGGALFMSTKVATGEELSPTPTGTFTIFKKTPSRYMQGPIPGVNDNPFDLPGVPWNMYFTQDGAVIHGSYWHDRYGTEQSSGCVNLPPEVSKILYDWAPLGTTVTIRN